MIFALLLAGCLPDPAPPEDTRLSVDDPDLTRHGAPRPVAPGPKVTPAPDRPPAITKLTLTPASPNRSDVLHVDVEAADPEGNLFDTEYAWFVNGAEIVGERTANLSSDSFTSGDKVHVTVTVDDGDAKNSATSGDVTVVNRSPVIRTSPSQVSALDGVVLQADDPDGDELVWSLTGGPPGLTLTPKGQLRYQGSETDPGGSYVLTLKVDDGHGGWGRLDVPIAVTPGSRAGK